MPHHIMRWAVPLGCLLLLVIAWRLEGWQGLALAGGALVMWLLLHTTRMMAVLRRAGERPVGHVASAVMFNAQLRRGATLLHVLTLTRALGQQRSAPDEEPAIWRWTDDSMSHVDCSFVDGRLVEWRLERSIGGGPAADAAGDVATSS
jgi:hypothetical protein